LAEPPDLALVARVADAVLAAACFAVDPCGTGVVLHADLADTGAQWLQLLRGFVPAAETMRRVPAHIDDERLLGGTDLAATLRCGRAIAARGLLEEADGGLLVLAMAERFPARLAACIGHALERGAGGCTHRSPLSSRPARFGVIALDSARDEEPRCPASLRDRLAMHLELSGLRLDGVVIEWDQASIVAARARLGAISCDADALHALCATAMACGIDSLRAPSLALRVARAHAALESREQISREDLQLAARLVFAARATVNPAAASEDTPPPPPPARPESQPAGAEPQGEPQGEPKGEPRENPEAAPRAPQPEAAAALDDQVLQAAQAAIPAGLLAELAAAQGSRHKSPTAGRAGAVVLSKARGRPAGVRAGRPGHGTRLNIVATLRTAAPWQRIRRLAADAHGAPRVRVHLSDFRVTWFRQRTQTVTVFVLDASGSSALHRLAEAKGAVELLLAECYVRRDEVAVVMFRGKAAELVLAPTRSLLRAKRSLAGLPGGGATPLAAGLDVARGVAEQVLKRGQSPSIVLLTDGHANVARDGAGGRARAESDSMLAARAMRAIGVRTILIDTAPRPQPLARKLAEALQARYLPLPNAEARSWAAAVQRAG
jgi:magnesium chelatase subunit D